MKITFLLPHAGLAGGIRVVAIYADRLQSRGHDVRIISTQYRHPRRRDRARAYIERLRRSMTGTSEPSHLNGIEVPHVALPHAGPIRNDDVPSGDVVIATWWETIEWMRDLDASKGTQIAFMQGYEAHASQPIDRVRAAWSSVKHKIVVAQWLADLARTEFGDDDAVLVPNSVDLDHFTAPSRDRRDIPTVGYLYSPKPIKGCDLLCEAVETARRSLPGLQVTTFGADPVTGAIPLPDRTAHHERPPQSAIPRLYASCDAWLFGSRQEGFGLPILEAMACRTPVIAMPGGAAPELLARGGGVLLPSHDPSAMAGAIVSMFADTASSWRAHSDAAYSNARSYNWDHATDRFEAALRSVINIHDHHEEPALSASA